MQFGYFEDCQPWSGRTLPLILEIDSPGKVGSWKVLQIGFLYRILVGTSPVILALRFRILIHLLVIERFDGSSAAITRSTLHDSQSDGRCIDLEAWYSTKVDGPMRGIGMAAVIAFTSPPRLSNRGPRN